LFNLRSIALALAIVVPSLAEAQLTAPKVVESPPAAYPVEELAERKQALVIVTVTVKTDGTIGDVVVAESGGPHFDDAAVAAAKKWRFQPALDGEKPIESQLRVPFRFVVHEPAAALPPASKPAPTPPPPTPTPTPAPAPPSPTPVAESAEFSSRVKASKAPPPRATSDFVLDREILSAAPHQSAGELLASAPGVYIARPEGDAVAHQVYLRGFDAEHGQDIEFTVGGVPVNQPSHMHGQGYADLNFIIPEVVRTLRVTEGVYDPRQGDFAVAGSIDFDLAVEKRGFQSKTSYGSFNTFRQLVLWAPKGQADETFGAVSIRTSDGFGQNRGSIGGAAIAQYAFGSGATHGLVHVSASGARASMAGVLRLDDIETHKVGYYDSYANPSANAQSAFAIRAQASVSLEHLLDGGARTNLLVYLVYNGFRERVNFTGFEQRSQQNPAWVGRGDLWDQENRDVSIGTKVSYRTRRFHPKKWLSGLFEVGLSYRLDLVDQAQNLLQAPQNETWDKRVDASIRGSDLGVYGDLDWHISRYVRLRGGIRADVLYYDIDDRLGNFTPSFMAQTKLVGFRRTALGVAWGPRATLEVEPVSWLTLMASYGEGYRSPQARMLEEGENAPFAKVRSVEGGAKVHLFADRLNFTVAGYGTFLSNDLIFDPTEGSTTQVGPTRRPGFVAYLVARPWPWLLVSASVTYVHATLDAPPPASAQNPAPPFTPGELLPYVPPVIFRADIGFHKDLNKKLWQKPVGLRAGLGFTHLSARPLPFGQFTDAVSLLDLSAGIKWWFLDLGVEAFNVAGLQYASVAYSYVSNWQTTAVPSLIPAQHITAGAPRTFMGTLGLTF